MCFVCAAADAEVASTEDVAVAVATGVAAGGGESTLADVIVTGPAVAEAALVSLTPLRKA